MEPGNTNADQEWGMHLCKLESFLPMGFQRHGLETNIQSVAFASNILTLMNSCALFLSKEIPSAETL